jgi:hypothetical protein
MVMLVAVVVVASAMVVAMVRVPVVVHGFRISRLVLCGQTSNPPGL